MLAFLFKNPSQLLVKETDEDPEKAKMLKAFREKLEEKRIVKYWEDGTQLINDIKDSIHDVVRRRPGVGWIRGNQALDPSIYKELEEARRQNKALQEKLDKLGNEDIAFPSHLARGEDLFEIQYKVKKPHSTEGEYGVYKISWDMLFDALGELALLERDGIYIRQQLERIIHAKKNIEERFGVEIEQSYIKQTRFQFESLGLIKAVANLDTFGIRWTLSEKGRRHLSNLRALKRGA